MSDVSCNLVEYMKMGLQTEGDLHRLLMLICVGVSLFTFSVSTFSGNMSQVDWMWSVLPVLYGYLCAVDTRTTLMAILIAVWFVRIKHTFYRRYGWEWPPWNREEDYRWEWVKQGNYRPILKNKYAFIVFNLLFISLYQNILVLLFSGAPCLVVWTMATSCEEEYNASLNWLDGVATVLFLLFVVIEGIGDNQQYAFQTEKYRRVNAKEKLEGEYADGFCQSGLFGVVRKPNYAAEQCIWLSFYLFTIAAGAGPYNWSLIGGILLVHLFVMSGKLTEEISQTKYPKYADYMKRVPLYVPFTKGKPKRE